MAIMMPTDHPELLLRIIHGTRSRLHIELQKEPNRGFGFGYGLPWIAWERIRKGLEDENPEGTPCPLEIFRRLREEEAEGKFETHTRMGSAGFRSAMAYLDHLHHAPLPPIAQFHTKPKKFRGLDGAGIQAVKRLRSLSPSTSLTEAKRMVVTENHQVAFCPYAWLLEAIEGFDGSWWATQDYFRIVLIGRP